MLIQRGADVNVLGGEYSDAMYKAVRYSYKKIVELLINAGADVNTPKGRLSSCV
jgi:hypothetical protein